jgi:hypothetical protein
MFHHQLVDLGIGLPEIFEMQTLIRVHLTTDIPLYRI